jgi:hypothetical protein
MTTNSNGIRGFVIRGSRIPHVASLSREIATAITALSQQALSKTY